MRSIDVDDINILEVQAFDDEGNVFSTVEGLKFQWRIEDNPQSIRIIPIKEAHFKASKKKMEMERKRQMTDITLLKGIKTGQSKISVQLIEDGYENVNKAEIVLSVIEPFTLHPSYPIYILPNSEFMYGIMRIKADHRFTHVDLPTEDFVFLSSQDSLGTILNTGLFTSKQHLGSVTVKAQDTAIQTNTAEGLVNIVEPDQLEIEVYDITDKINRYGIDDYAGVVYNKEGHKEIEGLKNSLIDLHENTWILVEDRYYLVNMFLFDQSKHKIELTDNLIFSIMLEQDFIDIYDIGRITLENKQISNLYIIKAKKVIARTRAIGKLSQVDTTDESVYPFNYERLIVERGIQITSQVKIHHPTPEVRLPYLGYYKQPSKSIEKQLWQLLASGGTGNYKWESNDERISLVKSSKLKKSLGEIRGNNLGETIIKVQDALNPFNQATIPVLVTRVGSLAWLEDKIEIEKDGSQGLSHLIAYDEYGKKYTNCSSLVYNLNMRKEDDGIIQMRIGNLNWTNTKNYLKKNIDLVTLKSNFDDNIDIMYASDLPRSHVFDQDLQFHNNFGICGSDKFSTGKEGLARVKASLPINYDTTKYPRAIETDNLQIASYESPHTVSPDYRRYFDDLRYPKEPMQHTKLFKSFYNSDVFKISYGSSLYWVYSGGTNYWADDIYNLEYSVNHNQYGLGVNCLSDNLPPLANRITYKFT